MKNELEYQTASLDKAISIYGNKQRLCEQLGISKHHIAYYYGAKAKRKLQPKEVMRMMELFPNWFRGEVIHPEVFGGPEIGRAIRKQLKKQN